MQSREIEIPQSTIDHGRIYFPVGDKKFFPADSFGSRFGPGQKGNLLVFLAGDHRYETDVRILTKTRIGPRMSFSAYLQSVGAVKGDKLRVTAVDDRTYEVEHIKTV